MIGGLLALTPVGNRLEEDIGLAWLFEARGSRPAPTEVMVVSLDRTSAEALRQPDKFRQWDRTLHAEVVDILRQRNAPVIVFDMVLEEPRSPGMDSFLSAAIEDANRVVLFQRLIRDRDGDKPVRPLSAFMQAADGLGSFPLPKIPSRVNYFWSFFPVIDDKASTEGNATARAGGSAAQHVHVETPTLPTVALQLQALRTIGRDAFVALLQESALESASRVPQRIGSAGELTTLMRALRRELAHATQAYDTLQATAHRYASGTPERRLLSALAKAYHEPSTRYLNYYGPARTIATISYRNLIDAARSGALDRLPDLSNTVVFVGGADISAVDQADGFLTVFTTDTGVDLSGVEIGATAYANLLHDQFIEPLPRWMTFALLLGLGCLLGFICVRLRAGAAVVGSLSIGLVYFVSAELVFAREQFWLPVVTPLAIQLPVALGIGVLWQYFTARRQRDLYNRGMRYYAPEQAVRRMETGAPLAAAAEVDYYTCLITDVAGYTTLTEKTNLRDQTALEQEYFDLVSRRIKEFHGEWLFIDGDSITGVWKSDGADEEGRRQACLAALAMNRDIREFNQKHPYTPFKTRIGLNHGELSAGNFGSDERGMYRVTGDTVNTAARIEGLNKKLGTEVLASGSVLRDLDGLHARFVGEFVMKGKTQKIDIYELRSENDSCTDEQAEMLMEFGKAMRVFRAEDWKGARAMFKGVAETYADGPSRYYEEKCEEYVAHPPRPGEGVVVILDEK